jgi:hypothetical protein
MAILLESRRALPPSICHTIVVLPTTGDNRIKPQFSLRITTARAQFTAAANRTQAGTGGSVRVAGLSPSGRLFGVTNGPSP